LLVDPTDDKIAYAVIANFSTTLATGEKVKQVYRTTTYGQQWTDITGNLANVPVWSIALNSRGGDHTSDVVYIGSDNGVYILIDPTRASPSWSRLSSGLPNVQV